MTLASFCPSRRPLRRHSVAIARGRILIAVLVSFVACNGKSASRESPPGHSHVAPVPVAGCNVPAGCDVLDAACQDAWVTTVSCLRAAKPVSAPIRVIDEDAAASELAARSSEPRPDPDHWEIALTMLSFVEPGAFSTHRRFPNVAVRSAPCGSQQRDLSAQVHPRPCFTLDAPSSTRFDPQRSEHPALIAPRPRHCET